MVRLNATGKIVPSLAAVVIIASTLTAVHAGQSASGQTAAAPLPGAAVQDGLCVPTKSSGPLGY